MSLVYTPITQTLAQGQLDMREAGHDLRVLLVMANSTAGTEEDTQYIAGFSVLDEFNGAGYARKALASQVVNLDTVNNRAEFSCTNPVWTALGAGTRQIIGAVLFRFVTNDADSPVISYIDGSIFPTNGNAGDLTFAVDVQGMLQVRAA